MSLYAGPLATIVASFSAVGVTGYFAWHQRNIALAQRDIAREKLRLDLFDKRYRAFETVFDYYKALVEWKGTDENRACQSAFFKAFWQSKFLFGPEVSAIFEEMNKAGFKVVGFKDNAKEFRFDPPTFSQMHTETTTILTRDFEDCLKRLEVRIRPYLDFPGSKIMQPHSRERGPQ